MEQSDSSTHFQRQTKMQILAEGKREDCCGEGQVKDGSLIFSDVYHQPEPERCLYGQFSTI